MAACEESPTTPVNAPRRTFRTRAIVVAAIDGPTARPDRPRLCERVRGLLEGSDADVVVIDVGALTEPDVGTVDALARVLLTARRLGRDVRLCHASPALQELLALAGLHDVVRCCAGPGPGSGADRGQAFLR